MIDVNERSLAPMSPPTNEARNPTTLEVTAVTLNSIRSMPTRSWKSCGGSVKAVSMTSA